MTDFKTTPLYASTDSRVNTGVGVSAGTGSPAGSRMIAGTNVGANGNHLQLRFDTSTIPDDETIVESRLIVTVSTAATPAAGCDFDLWAAEFGTAITIADYNKAATNTGTGRATNGSPADPGALRVKLGTIVAGNVALTLDQDIEAYIPSRFINAGTNGRSDFEIRPSIAGVPTASQTFEIYGPAETTETTSIPRISGISLTDDELREQNTYRFVGVGAESWLAFGIEATPGTPVKPRSFLELRSTTLDGAAENLASTALNRGRSRPRKIAPGRSGAGGDFEFELTPERWTALLLGLMKRTGSTGPDGNGVYTHTFTNCLSNEITFFTFVQRNGFIRQVFPGAIIGGLTINCSLDEIVTGSASVSARDEYLYDQESAGGVDDDYLILASAGYDTVENAMLTFVGGIVKFDGVVDGRLVQNATVTFAQDVNERRGLNRKRSVDGHFALGFMVDISFSILFENEHQLRAFLGVTGRDFPFAAEKNVVFQEVELAFEGVLGEDKQELSINIPKLSYTVVRKPINGEGQIILDCSGVAVYDPTSETNVTVTLKNTENPAVAFAAGTEEITVLPVGR